MPAQPQPTVNVKQAIAVGILAGLIVVAVVLVLDRMQKRRMWGEVDEALSQADRSVDATATERNEHDRGTDQPRRRPNSGKPEPSPPPGVPGDGLDGSTLPAPPSDA